MTLPTGVSTFLIECLDEDSAADYSTAIDSLKTYSSPETFRDDDFGESFGWLFSVLFENVRRLSSIERLAASLGVTHQVTFLLNMESVYLPSNLLWIMSLCNLNPTWNLKYSLLTQAVYWEWPTNVCSIPSNLFCSCLSQDSALILLFSFCPANVIAFSLVTNLITQWISA